MPPQHHSRPMLTVKARPMGPRCPFGNAVQFDLSEGGCVWLQGPSGRGKTSLAMQVAGIRTIPRKLDIETQIQWDESIKDSERCGVLFQETTLLDELTVAGNLAVAIQCHDYYLDEKQRDRRIKCLMDTVGLDYARDAGKRPTQLSGGMARRASLALQLAQRKHVIVLDEPFTGLDEDSGLSVAKELVHLRKLGTALILISHEHDLAKVVIAEGICKGNTIVELKEPEPKADSIEKSNANNLFGVSFRDRFVERFLDYVMWSLPLIFLTFTACGLAIAMLSSDALRRIDITDPVLSIVDREVKPMIKMITGEEPTMFHMIGINMKIRQLLNSTVPVAKARLYAMGLTRLFVLEIGPLLTALLLTGRIGGSYAGKLATMQATKQNLLLLTLGINPQAWSLEPALAAALLAGPILTISGTSLAIVLGSLVGANDGIGTKDDYWREVQTTIWPELRLRGLVDYYDKDATSTTTMLDALWKTPDFHMTFSSNYVDSIIEIATYPIIYHVMKAVTFMLIIMGVAETCARIRTNLTPRGVPSVITSSVVMGGLLVILADWAFSRLWLKRY